MKSESSNYKLGIFIFIGILLLIVSIFYVGQKSSLFSSTFTVKAYFADIKGLRNGAVVRLSGTDVGNVTKISILNDTTGRVEVTMKVVSEIKRFIKTDSKATIETEGIVGNKVVVLQIGSASAEEIEDGDVIQSVQPLGLNEIIAETTGIMIYTKELTKNLASIMAKINKGEGTLGQIISDDQLYYNAKKLTKTADESLTSITKQINQEAQLFDEIGKGVQTVIVKINKVVNKVDTTFQSFKLGKGVLGSLLVENSQYDSIFTDLVENVRQTVLLSKLSAERLAENMEALKHNWLFKGYFEDRGYWDKTNFENELDDKINELNEKIKQLDIRLEKLKSLENQPE